MQETDFEVSLNRLLFERLGAQVNLTSEHYTITIRQLLSSNSRGRSRMALEYYRVLRENPNLTPSKGETKSSIVFKRSLI